LIRRYPVSPPISGTVEAGAALVALARDHHQARFRSLFGEVPVPVRRLRAYLCRDVGKAKRFATLDSARMQWHPNWLTSRPGSMARQKQAAYGSRRSSR